MHINIQANSRQLFVLQTNLVVQRKNVNFIHFDSGAGRLFPMSTSKTVLLMALMMLTTIVSLVNRIAMVDGQTSKMDKIRRMGVESRIVTSLVEDNYDRFLRPSVSGCNDHNSLFIVCYLLADDSQHSSVVIIANVHIKHVQWRDNQAHVNLYLRQQWQDQRLRYEIDPREGITEVSIPINGKIWQPDTYFFIGDERNSDGKHQAVVEPSGYVRLSEQKTVLLPVSYGSDLPFLNVRTIIIRLGSYNYAIDDMVYMWADSPPMVKPVEVSVDLQNDRMQLTQVQTSDCMGNFSVGEFSCIEAKLTFKDSSWEPLFKVFIPSIVLVITSWLHFWIHGSWSVPRTASAAVPFFIFVVALALHSCESTVSGLHVWLSFCLLLTLLGLIEYFLVICCGIRRNVHYEAVSGDTEHPLSIKTNAVTAMTTKEAIDEVHSSRCADFHCRSGLDAISRFLFPIIFIAFLSIYLIWFLV